MEFYNEKLTDQNKTLLPFNNVNKLVKGYLNVATDEQAASWLADVLQPGNLPNNDRSQVMSELTTENLTSPDVLKETIRNMDLTNEQILEFHTSATSGIGDTYTDARLLSLKLFPTPQDRISALTQHYSKSNTSSLYQSERLFTELCRQLKTLGHSEQEINQLHNLKMSNNSKNEERN